MYGDSHLINFINIIPTVHNSDTFFFALSQLLFILFLPLLLSTEMENCTTCLMLGISSVLFAKCCKTKIFSFFTNHTHLQKYNVYYLTCGKSHQRWKQIFPHSASNKKNFVVRSSSNMWPGLYLLRSSLFIYLAGVCGGVTTSEVGLSEYPWCLSRDCTAPQQLP